MPVRSPPKRPTRAGAILAIVLASLLVASLAGLALVESLLIHHRQMHAMGRQQQCFWLAEAGLQRAARRLADDPTYAGESWEIAAEDLGTRQAAVVMIEVAESAESPQTREILIEARLPGDPMGQSACRRELTVSLHPLPNEL